MDLSIYLFRNTADCDYVKNFLRELKLAIQYVLFQSCLYTLQ